MLLASQGAEVLGLDIAPAAVRQAEAVLRVGTEGDVCGDLLNQSPELEGRFDWVVEHTCLCALQPELRAAYARAVHTALRTAGQLLAVFYRDVGDAHHHGPPFPISLQRLMSSLARRSGRAWCT